MELYKKHRPKTLDKMYGQDVAIKTLQQMISKKRIPHSILLSGPSGCGKTTVARILRRELKCSKYDFTEINCADFRGIDMVRDIRTRMMQAPIDGDCRMWLIDEAHKLSNDAQNAFLKMLEDTPNHVYFILATTEPLKLITTIKTRCTEIVLKSLTTSSLTKLIEHIQKEEKVELPEEAIAKIVENSDGSARKVLVLLDTIIDLGDEKEMLDAIEKSTSEIKAFQIAQALHNPRTRWPDMLKILKGLENEDVEQIRWMILGYAKSIMLKGGNLTPRAFVVLQSFRDNFYDSKYAGLVAACYEVILGGN